MSWQSCIDRGSGSSPRKFLQLSVQNPAIIDTSNEFIGLHIENHSGMLNLTVIRFDI